MKKEVTVFAVIVVFLFLIGGCKDKQPEAVGPSSTSQVSSQQMKEPFQAGGNPHAGLQAQEVPSGTGHKGKVVSTVDAAGYTYVQVEEKGQKIWVATMQTKVKVGDEVEFPDAQPMTNFKSKTLNRTFDKILFVPGIRVISK